MLQWKILIVTILLALLGITVASCLPRASMPMPTPIATVKLPEPRFESDISVEEAFLKRRSEREYANSPLTLENVSQLLWAAQGITDPRGFRTAPSAGGLYPLELYIVVGNVENLPVGVYKYKTDAHELLKLGENDVREQLAVASGQSWVKEGAVCVVISAVYERTTQKYGERGIRYVHMEAGHAAQNIYLQAVALDLGTVTVGGFSSEAVKGIMGMPENEEPLYLIPVGKKKTD